MDAKQVADLITILRAAAAIILVWLGVSFGPKGLTAAIWVMLADWIGDAVDGPIARRSRGKSPTWIGDNDLAVDMFVACGLLIYLLLSGYLSAWAAIGYFVLWGAYFWRQGAFPRSYGMLFQTPIYLYFLKIAIRDAPHVGWTIIAFILLVVVLTWPQFPKVIVPGFLEGFRKSSRN